MGFNLAEDGAGKAFRRDLKINKYRHLEE